MRETFPHGFGVFLCTANALQNFTVTHLELIFVDKSAITAGVVFEPFCIAPVRETPRADRLRSINFHLYLDQMRGIGQVILHLSQCINFQSPAADF